jgi:hypothetical protein
VPEAGVTGSARLLKEAQYAVPMDFVERSGCLMRTAPVLRTRQTRASHTWPDAVVRSVASTRSPALSGPAPLIVIIDLHRSAFAQAGSSRG